MDTVAIVGTGFVGRAWAISFARAGYGVHLWDPVAGAPQAALAYIDKILPDLEAAGLLNGQAPAEVSSRLTVKPTLADALAGVVHVQENTPEDLATKREIFAALDAAAAPDTVLSSSTSALLPSRFTDHLSGRARCLVSHPLNPPYLLPATEIVPAPWTDEGAVRRTEALLKAIGQAPIVMKRELDGFIMNRMQGALLEEAFRLVADGYATAEDIDVGIRDGLALRWSLMGPFETIDLNAPGGIVDYVQRYQNIYVNIFPQTQRRVDWGGQVLPVIEAERRKALPADKLVERQMWRDRRLMALAAHKRDADGKLGK